MEFNNNVICAKEFIALKIIDNKDDLEFDGGIVVPNSFAENERLAFGEIINIGETAGKQTGLTVGDFVMFDRLSTFGHTKPIATLHYSNVVYKTDIKGELVKPLRNMICVKSLKQSGFVSEHGVYVSSSYSEKLNIGIIIDESYDEDSYEKTEFPIGTKIILTKGADYVSTGTTDSYVLLYKKEQIVCKVLENEVK